MIILQKQNFWHLSKPRNFIMNECTWNSFVRFSAFTWQLCSIYLNLRVRAFPFSHTSCPRLPFPNLLCTAWSRCNSSQNLHYTQRSKMALTTFLFTRFLSLENPEFQRIFRLFSKKKISKKISNFLILYFSLRIFWPFLEVFWGF